MTVTVSEGMDAARVREIAGHLHREAHRLTTVSTQGTAQMGVLQEAWSGMDSQGFGQDWLTAERDVHSCSTHLAGYADALTRQTEQQGEASAGAGTGTGGSGAMRPGDGGEGGSGPKDKPNPKHREDTWDEERIDGPLTTLSDGEQAHNDRVDRGEMDEEKYHAIEPTDVEQGAIGDCWLITSMQAIAHTNPDLIERNVRDNGDGTYTVTLYDDGEPVDYVIRPEFPASNGDPQYADNPNDRELWPLLYEKAMAQHMGGNWEDIDHDSPSTGIEAITGQDTDTEGTGSGFLGLDPPPSTDEIRDILADEGQVTLSSHDEVDGRPAYEGADGVVTDHIYWVQEVRDDGTLVIVNPHDPTETAHEMSYEEYRENFSHITTSRP